MHLGLRNRHYLLGALAALLLAIPGFAVQAHVSDGQAHAPIHASQR